MSSKFKKTWFSKVAVKIIKRNYIVGEISAYY